MFEEPYSFNTLRAFKVQVQTAIKHASDTTGACLWKVWSMPLEGLEHCSWWLGALLLEAGGIPLGIQKNAFQGCESMSFRGSKACTLDTKES